MASIIPFLIQHNMADSSSLNDTNKQASKCRFLCSFHVTFASVLVFWHFVRLRVVMFSLGELSHEYQSINVKQKMFQLLLIIFSLSINTYALKLSVYFFLRK